MLNPTPKKRERGEAYSGKGYGALRFHLFSSAKNHIENSIRLGFYCEAITITESFISDRLESRLSYLKKQNHGFETLGFLIQQLIKHEEKNQEILIDIYKEIDSWRQKRNKALHELVKIEAETEKLS